MSCRAARACVPDPFAPGVIDAAARGQLPFCINFGSDGPTSAKLVCGFLACDAQPLNPLLENLPPVIKAGDPKDSNSGWVGQLVRQAMMELGDKRAGGESVLARLSELMFIEVIYGISMPCRRNRPGGSRVCATPSSARLCLCCTGGRCKTGP